MAIDIGLIAYNKYCEKIEKDLPKWSEVGKVEQDAWREAAVAVLQYIGDARDKLNSPHYDPKEIVCE